MNLSFLITLISVLYILQNVVESKKSKKKMQRRSPSITIIKQPHNNKGGKKPKPKSTTKRKTTSKKTTTSKPSHKPRSYQSPYYIKQKLIKYYLDKKLEAKFDTSIAIQTIYINDLTCLKIKQEKTYSKKVDIDIASCSESWVKLSTKKGKPTKVCLKKDETENNMNFYFGYALGLVPEITRYDSNLYVTVFKNNILPTEYKQFYEVQKYSSQIIANSSFDYYSKMLSSQSFKRNKNDKRTYRFETNLREYYEKTVNISGLFSHNDLKRLSYLYCDKECKKLRCKNYGYPKKNCKECACPMPFTGTKCEKINLKEKGCGKKQEFIANSSISSYKIKVSTTPCYYLIKSKNKKKVKFTVEKLSRSGKLNCAPLAGLTVKYREDRGAQGLNLCGNYKNISFPPLTSEIYLIVADNAIDELRFSIQEK
uniref:Astacin domain-containing protein n=1 Tax=Strongyloides venezuelensis TaxID=75913 RepID=A0A0K0FTD1_STRVS